MLHIATVHWNSVAWIDAQLASINRFAPEAVTWASLDGIGTGSDERFDHALHLEDLDIGELPESDAGREDAFRHGVKLNELARVISDVADPADGLLFLDGDALLLSPIEHVARVDEPLVAVRRDENRGDRYPHPSYCLTTVGFWNQIGGDWRRGAMWVNEAGRTVTDTGGFVLEALEHHDIAWRALTRRNVTNLHPLWFGVYGDDELGAVVYHHGAGFRSRSSRVDPRPTRDLLRLRTRAWRSRQRSLDETVQRWIKDDPTHFAEEHFLR